MTKTPLAANSPISLVSVIIPTYNHAHFIGRALQSVINQTYVHWEAIVIDNHSADNTDEVVLGFKDDRIKLIKIRNQGIIAASRNAGLKLASGEWVAFLDSDDAWHSNKLELCLGKLQQDFDLVCHAENWINQKSIPPSVRPVVYGPERRASFESLLFSGNAISTSAVVVRRTHLLTVGFFTEDSAINTAEDYELWLRLARAGIRIGFLPQVLGEYIIHGGNASKSAMTNMHATRTVFEKIYASIDQKSVWTQIRARRRRAIIDYSGARGLQANGDYANAWSWLFKAVWRWPFNARFYAAMVINLVKTYA